MILELFQEYRIKISVIVEAPAVLQHTFLY